MKDFIEVHIGKWLAVLVTATSFFSCAKDQFCFQYELCRKQTGMVFNVNITDERSLNLMLQNAQSTPIFLRDSILIFFYKFNQNLKSPFRDSVDQKSGHLTLYVQQSAPVTVLNLKLGTIVKIEPNDSYLIPLKATLLEQVIHEKGNLDNQNQLKNGFQLFALSSTKSRKKVQVASNVFRID